MVRIMTNNQAKPFIIFDKDKQYTANANKKKYRRAPLRNTPIKI